MKRRRKEKLSWCCALCLNECLLDTLFVFVVGPETPFHRRRTPRGFYIYFTIPYLAETREVLPRGSNTEDTWEKDASEGASMEGQLSEASGL